MKKAIKFVFKFIGVLVALVLVILLSVPLWIGAVIRPIANSTVPKMTQTKFHLETFALNPYFGTLELADVWLANPEGFSTTSAVQIGNISVDVDMTSLNTDAIVFENISVRDVFVSYVGDKDNRNNIDVIRNNVKAYLNPGKESMPEQLTAPGTEPTKVESAPEPNTEAKAVDKAKSKKIIINRLVISGVKVQLGPLPIPVPPITLTDIGRKSNGATLEEAWDQIMASVMTHFESSGAALQNLTGNLINKTGNLSTKGKEAVKNTTSTARESTAKILQGTGEAVRGVGQGVGKTVEGVGKAFDKLFSK